jgi:hypothetical protein
MKKLTIIIALLLCLVSCKKEQKCLIGGKWYHEYTMFNGVKTSSNNGTWIEFSEDGYIYTSYGQRSEYIATDTKVNNAEYQCKGNELKIQFGIFNQNDIPFTDFDKNHSKYKR